MAAFRTNCNCPSVVTPIVSGIMNPPVSPPPSVAVFLVRAGSDLSAVSVTLFVVRTQQLEPEVRDRGAARR